MRLRRSKALLATGAVITALAAAGCSIPAALPAVGQPAATGQVISLTSISTLKALFNRADGHARLVLIFSPT